MVDLYASDLVLNIVLNLIFRIGGLGFLPDTGLICTVFLLTQLAEVPSLFAFSILIHIDVVMLSFDLGFGGGIIVVRGRIGVNFVLRLLFGLGSDLGVVLVAALCIVVQGLDGILDTMEQ